MTGTDEKMTVRFDRRVVGLGPITLRTSAPHYATAIDRALDEVVDVEEDGPEVGVEPEDCDAEFERAKTCFYEECALIRVWRGWPTGDADEVSGLELIHEEQP